MWLYRCWRYIRIVQSAFDLLLFHMNSQGTRILRGCRMSYCREFSESAPWHVKHDETAAEKVTHPQYV